MKYKAYLKQAGKGCDYTIGCAQTVISIDANNMDEAKQKLTATIIEEYSYDEGMLDSAELYECNEVFTMSIDEIYAKKEQLKQQEEQKRQEEAERREYERLKHKFS